MEHSFTEVTSQQLVSVRVQSSHLFKPGDAVKFMQNGFQLGRGTVCRVEHFYLFFDAGSLLPLALGPGVFVCKIEDKPVAEKKQ